MRPFYSINEVCLCYVSANKVPVFVEVKIKEIYQIKNSLKQYKILPTYKVLVLPQVVVINNCKYSITMETCKELTVSQVLLRKKLKPSNSSFKKLVRQP